jgi:hypothetical protein
MALDGTPNLISQTNPDQVTVDTTIEVALQVVLAPITVPAQPPKVLNPLVEKYLKNCDYRDGGTHDG